MDNDKLADVRVLKHASRNGGNPPSRAPASKGVQAKKEDWLLNLQVSTICCITIFSSENGRIEGGESGQLEAVNRP